MLNCRSGINGFGRRHGARGKSRIQGRLAVPMATLIICPVCDTRYETKAVFPPEGRKVRCSKCSHVWQAQPVALEDLVLAYLRRPSEPSAAVTSGVAA